MRLSGFLAISVAISLAPCGAEAAPTKDPASQLERTRVVDSEGRPLRGVAARVPVNDDRTRFVSVFSDADGRFPDVADRVQNGDLSKAEFVARGHGVETPGDFTSERPVVKMSRAALRPEDVPAAAWVQKWPEGTARQVVATQCVQCHQFPGPVVRQFAQGVGQVDAESERQEAWHGVIASMRTMSAQVTGRMSRTRFKKLGSDWRTGSESFLSARVGDVIAPFLAKEMPRDFSTANWNASWEPGDQQALNGVAIEEFWIKPELNSWFREVTYSPKSQTVIGVDLGGNRMFELNPKTGVRTWIPIPVTAESIAPHTIVTDDTGGVWVSLEDINGAGRYDPVAKSWKIYRDLFGQNMISHDFATGASGNLMKDTRGRIWISLVSHNHIAALDPESGRAEMFTLPPRKDGTKEPTLPYGVVMTGDGKHVWISQHAGDRVLRISTETGKVVETVDYPEGYSPRRMSIDEQDRVWVALSGRSALGLIEQEKGATKEFPLPLAVSYPYNTLWDPVRQRVWVGTTNVGELLEFDPRSERFRRYVLPAHREAYIRQLSRNPETGDIWTIYASKLGDKAEVAVVRVTPELLKQEMKSAANTSGGPGKH